MAAEESSEVAKIYKNIRRWRGGQLAISTAGGYQFYTTSTIKTEYDTDCIPSLVNITCLKLVKMK